MRVAFLFAGQGAQRSGLSQQIPDHPAAAATLAEAEGSTDPNFNLADEDMASTRSVQLALLIAGVASARALEAEGIIPDLVAGLSVGAYAAAVVAGAISFRDALTLVGLRGRLMQEAFPTGYGMAAITGLSEIRVQRLLAEATSPASPVFLANVNAPAQMVIAGADAGLARALAAAQIAGAVRTERLTVTVPSHCRLLNGVADRLRAALAPVTMVRPRFPYLSNRRARALTDPEAIREDLATNVAHPVRWHDAMTSACERGVRLFVSMPPGRVLTGLIESTWPDVPAVALERTSWDRSLALIAAARAE